MTTKDIRQQALDRMNGKVMAGPNDDPFETPMTFNEAVHSANGLREEAGLVGSVSVAVQHYSNGLFQSLSWRAHFFDDTGRSVSAEETTAERMIEAFRLALRKCLPPEPINLASVGAPSLDSEKVS